MNKYCNRCSYKGTLYCSEMSKGLNFPECLKNSAFNKAQGSILEQILNKEYNTDTSAGHPIKDDDIVRYSEETQRVQDKELEH